VIGGSASLTLNFNAEFAYFSVVLCIENALENWYRDMSRQILGSV
jgi:hypothetical protein